MHVAKEQLRRCTSGRNIRAIAAFMYLGGSNNRDDVRCHVSTEKYMKALLERQDSE